MSFTECNQYKLYEAKKIWVAIKIKENMDFSSEAMDEHLMAIEHAGERLIPTGMTWHLALLDWFHTNITSK